MVDILSWLGWLCAIVGAAMGWHFGRARELRRIERRLELAMSQLERRHRKEVKLIQAAFSKQAQELIQARDVALEAQNRHLPEVHAQQNAAVHRDLARQTPSAVGGLVATNDVTAARARPTAFASKPEPAFAPTQPMESFSS